MKKYTLIIVSLISVIFASACRDEPITLEPEGGFEDPIELGEEEVQDQEDSNKIQAKCPACQDIADRANGFDERIGELLSIINDSSRQYSDAEKGEAVKEANALNDRLDFALKELEICEKVKCVQNGCEDIGLDIGTCSPFPCSDSEECSSTRAPNGEDCYACFENEQEDISPEEEPEEEISTGGFGGEGGEGTGGGSGSGGSGLSPEAFGCTQQQFDSGQCCYQYGTGSCPLIPIEYVECYSGWVEPALPCSF